ncbi:MAG: YggS family pyridoxal phosphate-dependent enzyme [Spirochaetae bacterium HGW-Spirochaetae-3]|nr:MAG: YggS family pyridoxal phosphate-dependent enzyme [Spirochaetae bacterium HGW-Spirochaetae-3]
MTEEYATEVASRIAGIRERIADACGRAGRPAASVELLAVTKFNPADAVEAAWKAGVRSFGENRVQEAEAKFSALAGSIPGSALHLLGHLQSNKAKKAVSLFDCVQSIDSESILADLARRAAELGKTLDVLFELHTGEESKSGFPDADALFRALETAAALPSLRPRGLMTMAPYTDDEGVVRSSFKSCAAAFDKAKGTFGFPCFDLLSMGMTNDFETAIEEGSTMVRVGTAIFGARSYA